MNSDAIACPGMPAWLPNRAAVDLDSLHTHDFPLIGTFRLLEETVLFACLTGATSPTNYWGYVSLAKDDLAQLERADFDSTQDLEFWAQDRFVGRRAVLARARDGRVDRWGVEDVAVGEGILDAVIRWMDMLIEQRANCTETKRAQRHQAEQARADATRLILEPA